MNTKPSRTARGTKNIPTNQALAMCWLMIYCRYYKGL